MIDKFVAKIVGALRAITNLDADKKRKVEAFRTGLTLAGLYVQREAQKITPVDTGLLRNSARTELRGSGEDTEVVVSFSTSYAIYVHEDPDAKHPIGEYKFLEKAYTRNKTNIAAIIEDAIDNA